MAEKWYCIYIACQCVLKHYYFSGLETGQIIGLIEPSLIWPLVCCSVHGQGGTLKQVVLIWMKNKPFNWIKSPNHCHPIANFEFNISIKGLKNHQSVDICMYTTWPAIQRRLSRKQRQVGWRQGGWMATGHTQDAQSVLLSPFPLWGHCVHWVCFLWCSVYLFLRQLFLYNLIPMLSVLFNYKIFNCEHNLP